MLFSRARPIEYRHYKQITDKLIQLKAYFQSRGGERNGSHFKIVVDCTSGELKIATSCSLAVCALSHKNASTLSTGGQGQKGRDREDFQGNTVQTLFVFFFMHAVTVIYAVYVLTYLCIIARVQGCAALYCILLKGLVV